MQYVILSTESTIDQKYDIEGFGFFIKNYPSGLKAYIVVNDNPNTLRDLSTRRVIKFAEPFKYFRIITQNTVSGEQLELYIVESLEEFQDLPSNDQKQVTGTLSETNSILTSIDNKITNCDTDNIIIATDNAGLAKDATLSNLNSKITKCDTDNITIVSDSAGLAKETTLSSIDSKITKCDTDNITITGNTTDYATETTLAALNNKVTLIDTNNVKQYHFNAVLQGKAWCLLRTWTGNNEIVISNPSGSGKTVLIYALIYTGDTDTDITWYLDRSGVGSGTSLTPFSLQIGSSNTYTFSVEEDTSGTVYSGGTTLGSEKMFATTQTHSNVNDMGVIQIVEGHSLSFNFSTTGEVSIKLFILEV